MAPIHPWRMQTRELNNKYIAFVHAFFEVVKDSPGVSPEQFSAWATEAQRRMEEAVASVVMAQKEIRQKRDECERMSREETSDVWSKIYSHRADGLSIALEILDKQTLEATSSET